MVRPQNLNGDELIIKGGNKLSGTVMISGAKNSSLKLMIAALLTPDEVLIRNVPDITDITNTSLLLRGFGAHCEFFGESSAKHGSMRRGVRIQADDIKDFRANPTISSRFRTSILALGPMLGRFGECEVGLPGGCPIGSRLIDEHVKGLRALGADVQVHQDKVYATTHGKRLVGAHVELDMPSVGATENVIMAAALADGITELSNAALEPEVLDLAALLNKMGGRIHGAGTKNITIEGVKNLSGADHKVMGDRIEAGTYAIAGIITRGKLDIQGIDPTLLDSFLVFLESLGVSIIRHENDGFFVSCDKQVSACNVITEAYPGFPTDMQPQVMSLLCTADGTSTVEEAIFENRMMHVPHLCKMGAEISLTTPNKAVIKGGGGYGSKLIGTDVVATDIRAAAALILAGLIASGETRIHNTQQLYRGYEHFMEKLALCGAVYS